MVAILEKLAGRTMKIVLVTGGCPGTSGGKV